MDFVNRAWTQLTELFRSMSPGARLTAALLLAVVVASLGYLFKYQSSGAGVYLMGGQQFSGADMDAALAALAKANLEWELEGTRIRIPRGH
jgi:flagellar M-ring protein FliF